MRKLIPSLALLALAWGCQDSVQAASERPLSGDAGAPSVARSIHTLSLEILDPEPLDAPLRALVEGREGLASTYTLDAEMALELSLPEGAYQVTIFRDRADDGLFDACPFPPLPSHVERADERDNIYGRLEVELFNDQQATVTLERSICGPGEPMTGVEGVLQAPLDAPTAPVIMLVRPLEEAATRPALRVPLFPEGLVGARPFSVGELLPGLYEITFFVDEDGDASPSPCGAPMGGGDRAWVTLDRVEIETGARLALDELLELSPSPSCPEALTGVEGTIDLELPKGALDEDHAGALNLGLFSLDGRLVHQARLLEAVDERPLPLPFTLTGLAPGDYTLAIWLDRDGDAHFTPCGGLVAGYDGLSLRRAVRVEEGSVLDTGGWTLEARACEGDRGVEGELTVEVEPGAMGSGRPIRLALYPIDAPEEHQQVLLFENHAQVQATTPFIRTDALRPGPHRARIYVDTDRDGRFLSCEANPYGDRSSTETFMVEVDEEGRVDLGRRALLPLGCPVPQVELWPVFWVGDLGVEGHHPLRVQIEERGGWRDDRLLMETFEPNTPSRLSLTPGQFRITAYLDSEADARFTSCVEGAGDAWFAELELELEGSGRLSEVEIELRRCGP